MSGAPAGIVGKIAAHRPVLAMSILSAGLISLCAAGLRRAEPGVAGLILEYVVNALYVIALPMTLVAMRPRQPLRRVILFAVIFAIGGVLVAADAGRVASLTGVSAPPYTLTLAAMGLTAFLLALAPITANTARLSAAAPLAAVLGVAGGAGYLTLEAVWGTKEGALAVSLALALGAGTGVSVGADFARFFSAGEPHKHACAAAGHSAVATAAFSLLAVAAFFGVQTFNANFGSVQWNVLWAGVTMASAAMVAALFAVTGTLSMAAISEQAAVNENRRRQWFAAAWRPMRRILPVTTAVAVTAIAGVAVVVAVFEAGFSTPVAVSVFFLLIWLAAAVAFVSLKTSILIMALLGAGAVLTGYFYAALSLELPGLPERLGALALCAAALGHLTVSWRDAGDVWRNPRDVAENALGDGVRRFAVMIGVGAGAFFVSAHSFVWEGGYGALLYFLTAAFFSLLLAPAVMMTLSARANPA